ncbi:MAG: PfkB family carbohydrate kinase [Siculibacillus sp.]|nr:PfkB family carbohydrate kinase [Siculibacillus sp.]
MIVAFGTINVDMVTVVPRFPVPGETVKGRDYQLFPGGKGANQAVAAARAGARVALVGCVGRDGFAEVALAGARALGIDLGRVRRSDSPTGVQMIAVDPSGENLMIGADAANRSARADQLAGLLGPGATLLTQNSLGTPEVERAIAMAHSAGARVIYNAAPAEPVAEASFAAADVVIVNEHEARGYADRFGLPPGFRAFAEAAATRFATVVVVTLGPRGLIAARPGGPTLVGGPPDVVCVDSTGAGDALCGAIAAALDRGDDLETALRQGLAAGALACRETGAQTSFRDLAEILRVTGGVRLAPAGSA